MICGLKQRLLPILLIIAAAFAVYAPSLNNGFVWDDSALIQRDPFIRSWRLIPEGFRHFLFTDATPSDFYRPIQRLTYTWDYAWRGFHPGIYHFDNILLHALAGVFLFLFLRSLLAALGHPRPVPWASGAALLWVIHPLFTSAVCYVSGRADLLAGMFGFCGLWLAVRNTRTSTAVAAVMFLLAVLSKESAAIFPVMCIALAKTLHKDREPALRWLVYSILIAAAAATLRLTAEHFPTPASTPLPWSVRPIVALRALAEYAGLFLAPVRLHMERDVLPFNRAGLEETLKMARLREFQTLLGALLLAGLGWWAFWAVRRDRPVAVLLGCFIVAYLPVCGLFGLNARVAEHWLYVPGAFLMPAALLTAARLRLSPAAGVTILAAWGAFLAARTFARNPDWHDQRTFVERTIADGGGSGRMWINLGGLELTEGHTEAAIADLRKALTLEPDQPFGLVSLGAAYLRAKQYDLARTQFERALDFPVTSADALDDLAVLEYVTARRDRLDLLEKAAEIAPENWDVQKRFVMHLGEIGQLRQQITRLRLIVFQRPWRAETWVMLGDAWAHVRQFDSAARAYRKAIALDVHDEETPRKLADAEDQLTRR